MVFKDCCGSNYFESKGWADFYSSPSERLGYLIRTYEDDKLIDIRFEKVEA